MTYPPVTPTPTQADFIANFVYGVMGVPVAWLPSDSITITYAYNTAVATVNPAYMCIPGPIYLQMVYNLAAHLLLMWAQDPTTTPPWPYQNIDGVQYGFFGWYRKQNNMLGAITGTVQAASDNGTSTSLVVPQQAQNLTMAQLGLTTTPFGRYYLGLAQSSGEVWGMS